MLVGSCISGTFANMKIERQGWPEMSIILGRFGIQYVALEIKLLTSNSGAHLVESYCKESNISDTNWIRYLFSSYLIKTWLSIWRHHLANLHILKTWTSLEQKEIFENSKQHFSSYAGHCNHNVQSKKKVWRAPTLRTYLLSLILDIILEILISSCLDFEHCTFLKSVSKRLISQLYWTILDSLIKTIFYVTTNRCLIYVYIYSPTSIQQPPIKRPLFKYLHM